MTNTECAFPAQDVKKAFVPLIPHRNAIARIADILDSGRIFRYEGDPEQSDVTRLEIAFARMLRKDYAVAMNSCSSTILVSLLALKLRGVDTSKVLLTAFTFVAVPGAIVGAGAQPVFVNANKDLRLDLDDLRRKAKESGAKVLLLSHMRGHTVNMDAALAFCSRHGITLVEDAAHALGATWRGNPIGTFGTVGCFSFQDYKILKAGEGGVLVTDDPHIAAIAALYSGAYERNHRFHTGIEQYAFREYVGRISPYNFRYSEIQAACVLAQLPELDTRISSYRALYARVVEGLSSASSVFVFPQGDSRECRAPDSLQFRIPSFSPSQMKRFVAEITNAGFPLTCIGIDEGNARFPASWRFLPEEALTGLEPTLDMLATLCDMRLPPALSEDIFDYMIDVFGQAARHAALS